MTRPDALTTHVLDTTTGRPAVGMTVELWRLHPDPAHLLTTTTNADGRTDAPLLAPETFRPGRYELRFHVGAHYGTGADGFLDVVPLRVGLAAGGGHYHVPLLCTPFSYATYRGS